MPELSPIYTPFLPDVYRYAFLMTGSAATATEVLRSTVDLASRGFGDHDRRPGRGKNWLFAKARDLCRQPQLPRPAAIPVVPSSTADDQPLPAVPAADDAANAPNRLAAFFAILPEVERSAMVLFYLYLFNPAELAEVLEIKPADLGALLGDARALLQQHKVQWAALLVQMGLTTGNPVPDEVVSISPAPSE